MDMQIEDILKSVERKKMSNETKNKILSQLKLLENMEVNTIHRKVKRNKGWILGTLASSLAIALATGLYIKVQYGAKIPKQQATKSSASVPYNYRNLIGFQPTLPNNSPQGFKLTNVDVTIDKGAAEGDVYTFHVIYQAPQGGFQLTETKSTENRKINPNVWRPIQLAGHTAYESNTEAAYTLLFQKSGINYTLSMTTGLTVAQLQSLSLQLNSPASAPPNMIDTTIAGEQNALRAISFVPKVPTYIPSDYRLNVVEAHIVSSQIQKSEQFVQVYRRGNDMFTISESPQPFQVPDKNNNIIRSQTISGSNMIVVTSKVNENYNSIQWTDKDPNISFSIGGKVSVLDIEKVIMTLR